MWWEGGWGVGVTGWAGREGGPALGPGLGLRARSRVRAFMFPRATSEGFLLSTSSARAELRVPAGCQGVAVV